MKKFGFVAAVLLFFMGSAFGEPKMDDAYQGMRKMTLELTAKDLELPADTEVLAILMETGYPEAVATLVSVADGSASIYFSNGGGVMGAGEHEGPHKASLEFIKLSKQYLPDLKPAKATGLPVNGRTKFYVVTSHGVLTGDYREDNLGNGREKLSPLFLAGHRLLTEIRKLSEKHEQEMKEEKK